MTDGPSYEFTATLWRWDGEGAAWIFVTLPENVADEVDEQTVGPGRGFGAVKVRVTIGATTWTTSMFPSTKHESYILPLKKSVRTAEKIDEGDTPAISITLIPA